MKRHSSIAPSRLIPQDVDPRSPGCIIWKERGSCAVKLTTLPHPLRTLQGRSIMKTANKVVFKYREGQRVALREDHPRLSLSAGDAGVIWCMYNIDPPTYEVNFRDKNGKLFGMTLE